MGGQRPPVAHDRRRVDGRGANQTLAGKNEILKDEGSENINDRSLRCPLCKEREETTDH